MPFIEAFRQFQFRVGLENFCNIHVSLVPQVSYRRPVSKWAVPSIQTDSNHEFVIVILSCDCHVVFAVMCLNFFTGLVI